MAASILALHFVLEVQREQSRDQVLAPPDSASDACAIPQGLQAVETHQRCQSPMTLRDSRLHPGGCYCASRDYASSFALRCYSTSSLADSS